MTSLGYSEAEARPRMGFFTDTSLCIGCKACEVACKEWNRIPDSIQFGELGDLRERAHARVLTLHEAGVEDAQLYGADPDDGVGGMHSFFLLLDEPEAYSLPPDPKVTTRDLGSVWGSAFAAAGALAAGIAAVALFGGRR